MTAVVLCAASLGYGLTQRAVAEPAPAPAPAPASIVADRDFADAEMFGAALARYGDVVAAAAALQRAEVRAGRSAAREATESAQLRLSIEARQRARARAARLKVRRERARRRAERLAAQSRPSGGLVVGDSVSLGAASCLTPMGYRLDSEVGRQFEVGVDRLRAHAAGGLPGTVVIHLGTNGPFSADRFHDVMDLVGGDRRVVWVTIHLPERSPYGFVDSLNAMIRTEAAGYDNVRVADFAAAAEDHPEWFAADGIHIGGSGCTGFASVVDAAVTSP